MLTNSPASSRLAPALFLIGLLWLAVLAFFSAWPDMEASVFDSGTASAADQRLQSLRCPWVITASETATVRATFVNRADRPASFLVRSRVSEGFQTIVREETEQVTVEPGGRRELAWPVSAADAVFDRIVMVRVLATRSAVSPAREKACGILVVGFPIQGIPGRWIFLGSILFGIALTGGGAHLWLSPRRPLRPKHQATARRAGLLAGGVISSLVVGLGGWWLVSHLLLIAAGLLVLLLLEDVYGSLT